MAYAVLCSLAETTHQILNHHEYPLSVNGKKKIASLRKQIISLREFLEEFPKEAKSLETRMREAANEGEDVIEHFMYEHIRSSADGLATGIQYDLGELKMAMEEINSIVRETTSIRQNGIGRLSDTPAKHPVPVSLSTAALEPPVSGVTVGLEEYHKKIQAMVCEGSLERQIIPITGIGGLGKTTLAKKVYDDPLVKAEFPIRAWITVTQDYETEDIFAGLLLSLQNVEEKGLVLSGDSTADRVDKILMVRKYFIVLDDIWSEQAWDEISKAFRHQHNFEGSRILITTRIESVASYAAPLSPLQKMKFMDPYKSWSLLHEKVFPDRICPLELVNIGRDIATKCRGLPFAIVVVARKLSKVKETRPSWKEFAENLLSIIQKDVEFQNRMSLSYIDLPHYLRPYLLYIAGIPEECDIRVSKLIKLWIAEGFAKREVEAEEYLNSLVNKGLPLIMSTKSNGKIKSCKVFELVRNFFETVALDDNFERRLSVAHPDLRCVAKVYASTVRSVICFQPTESSLLGLRKMRLLRVLDVDDTNAYMLPPQVFELFHLRYLAFSCSIEIPAAISRLQNLRTLIVRPSKGLKSHPKDEVYLPLEVWMMPLLTHLVSLFDLLPNPEGVASVMEKLLTLSVVKKLICTEEMMAMIPNVKKLGITYSGDKYKEDYRLENLVLLHHLEKLTLVLEADSVVGLTVHPVFPKTLKKLTLSGWRLPWDYMGMIGSLPELQVLKLRNHAFEGDKWETEEGQFPKLEKLHIDSSNLEEWITGSSDFPKLRHLVIYRCYSLTAIPYDIGDIASLQLLEVDQANESLVECVKGIQEEQRDNKNDLLEVRFVDDQGF